MQQPQCPHIVKIDKWDLFTNEEQAELASYINKINEIGDRPGLVGAIADAEFHIGLIANKH